MMTIEASVPISGKIIIESTPSNVGDLYHRMWVSDNDYVKRNMAGGGIIPLKKWRLFVKG